MSPIHTDALGDTAVHAYERLRTRILEAGGRSDELGLGCARNGMLAWLRAHGRFSEVARDVPEPTRVSGADELVQVDRDERHAHLTRRRGGREHRRVGQGSSHHLGRNAYLYVRHRCASPRAHRQYALKRPR